MEVVCQASYESCGQGGMQRVTGFRVLITRQYAVEKAWHFKSHGIQLTSNLEEKHRVPLTPRGQDLLFKTWFNCAS